MTFPGHARLCPCGLCLRDDLAAVVEERNALLGQVAEMQVELARLRAIVGPSLLVRAREATR